MSSPLITVCRQSAPDFFGYQPNTIPEYLNPEFVHSPVPPNDNIVDVATFRILQYIDLATRANATQESAIDDIARELLRLLNFEEKGTLLQSCYAIYQWGYWVCCLNWPVPNSRQLDNTPDYSRR